jgi:hypothetical protein
MQNKKKKTIEPSNSLHALSTHFMREERFLYVWKATRAPEQFHKRVVHH